MENPIAVVRSRTLAFLAGQLGHPRGLPGRLIGRMLNRGNRAAITGAVAALAAEPGATLADFGFGGGLGLALLLEEAPDTRVVGADISTEMLAGARKRFASEIAGGRLVLHEAHLHQLPLESDSVDGAITLNTIYFIEDLDAAFRELARVLRPTGRLVIGMADPEAMKKMPVTAHGFILRPVAEVTAAVMTSGLQLSEHRRIGSGPTAFHLLVTTNPGA